MITEKKARKAKKIEINLRFCKGCGICVTFCPKQVLALQSGKAVVKDLEACTKCDLCELRCPDFAIQVFPREED